MPVECEPSVTKTNEWYSKERLCYGLKKYDEGDYKIRSNREDIPILFVHRRD